MTRAVVFAGGLGTRLRPYTTILPKPLMPVGDRPVLDIIVRQLERAGFERITIATGHHAELIEAFFGDGSRFGVSIDYFREDEPLGTIGALGLIEGLDEDFLVTNGDILSDIDHAGLLEEHRSTGALATLATRRTTVRMALGVVHRANHGDPSRLAGYSEKPSIDYEVSMGVYGFSPAVLDRIEPGVHLDFPELLLRLIDEGADVRAWECEAYWRDIGRPEDYELAVEEFDAMRPRLLVDS